MDAQDFRTPTTEARKIMKFDKPANYKVRVLQWKLFYSVWLPCIVVDRETGGFVNRPRQFQMPFDPETKKTGIFWKLGAAEKAMKKELMGDIDEAKRSAFQPRVRYRMIGFDLSGSENSDPNVLATFDFGYELWTSLDELSWGTREDDKRILKYGPLFLYDVYIKRYIVPKTGIEAFDTKWRAEPVNKVTPFDGSLTLDIRDDNKWNAWFKSLDLSKFFTPEQMAVIKNTNVREELNNTFDYVNNESIVTRLITEPINMSAESNKRPVFIPSTVPKLMERMTKEVKALGFTNSSIALLNAPQEEEVTEFPEETSVVPEKGASIGGSKEDWDDTEELPF
jgi:hypothetical protein